MFKCGNIRFSNIANKFVEGITHLIYPQLCAICNSEEVCVNDTFCIDCFSELPFTNQCQLKQNTFKEHFEGKVKIIHGASLLFFVKQGIIQRLIHDLKYKNKPDIGIKMGKILGYEILKSPHFGKIDFVVPVPLHRRKKSIRGYNQSQKIALGVSNIIGSKTVTENIVRVKNTATQTKMNLEQRSQNVDDAFTSNNQSIFKNKHVLIVDDVLTTGSTLLECSKPLRKIQGVKLSFATLAMGEYV